MRYGEKMPSKRRIPVGPVVCAPVLVFGVIAIDGVEVGFTILVRGAGLSSINGFLEAQPVKHVAHSRQSVQIRNEIRSR